jgi:leucyl aminopeptidase
MNFELKVASHEQAFAEKYDALLVLVSPSFKAGPDKLSVVIAQALKTGDLEGKAGKLLQLYAFAGVAAPRVVLVHWGDESPKQTRQAVSAAIGAVKGSKTAKKVGLLFVTTGQVTREAIASAVVASADASYQYTSTKSKPEGRTIGTLTLLVANSSGLQVAFDQSVATVRGIELAKEWGNRPANHATPTMLARAAKSLSKFENIKCDVLGPKQVAKLGMGSFMAVSAGSKEELRFVVLRYSGAAVSRAPVVLVGKGITFDTGGISIKPAAEMDEMKFDMCGAASVLGVFRALADLKPAVNVIGLIPTCENMPGGRALKPGDVVTSMSGQTIEVLNTDAEGRLILCDALTYAERFKPAAVIDVATLTGACVVALGAVRSGMFASTNELAHQLEEAGDSSQDLCWRMPLDEEYAEGLKSNFADVANVSGRAAGAVTAAKFLQRFAKKFPWAHLDIAGTAWKSGAAKGSTGRPVGLLLAFLRAQAANAGSDPVAIAVAKPRKKLRQASVRVD